MAPSTTAVRRLARLPTSLVPRQTKELSTQVFEPSTGLASLAGSGPRAASNSRVLQELPGKSHDGLRLREPILDLAPKTLLPRRLKVATKRTKRKPEPETKATVLPTAIAVLMSRCKARQASKPRRQHPLLWRQHHKCFRSEFFLFSSSLWLTGRLLSSSTHCVFDLLPPHFVSLFFFSVLHWALFVPNLEKKLGSGSAFCFIGSEDGTLGYL